MPPCVFNTCCGCIELRTGCLIIGYLNLIVQIILIAFFGIAVLTAGVFLAKAENKAEKDFGTIIIVLAVFCLLVLLCYFANTISLLLGIHKNERGLVKAYLKMSVKCVVVSIAILCKNFAGEVYVEDIVGQFVFIALNIYFIMVIRSYFHKMNDNKRVEEAVVYNAA